MRSVIRPFTRGPADVRHASSGRREQLHFAGEQPKALMASELIAVVEQQLRTEADTEEWKAVGDSFAQSDVKPLVRESLHPCCVGANAR